MPYISCEIYAAGEAMTMGAVCAELALHIIVHVFSFDFIVGPQFIDYQINGA